MYRYAVPRRAPRQGALFAFWLLAFYCWPVVQAKECLPFQADEWVKVKYVHDGDTIRLMDGRKVRLIGINAPEVAYDDKPGQPLGREAGRALSRLTKGQHVALRYGREKKDRYGRLLAHVYLADQRNVQEWMLEKGLAAAIAISPNLRNVDCYQAAEGRAKGVGIWRQPPFQAVDSRYLPRDARGFRIVLGVVERVGESRQAIWLNLPNRVAIRVNKNNLSYFKNHLDVRALEGKKLKVRGWLYERRGELRMQVYHPAALEILKQ